MNEDSLYDPLLFSFQLFDGHVGGCWVRPVVDHERRGVLNESEKIEGLLGIPNSNEALPMSIAWLVQCGVGRMPNFEEPALYHSIIHSATISKCLVIIKMGTRTPEVEEEEEAVRVLAPPW